MGVSENSGTLFGGAVKKRIIQHFGKYKGYPCLRKSPYRRDIRVVITFGSQAGPYRSVETFWDGLVSRGPDERGAYNYVRQRTKSPGLYTPSLNLKPA